MLDENIPQEPQQSVQEPAASPKKVCVLARLSVICVLFAFVILVVFGFLNAIFPNLDKGVFGFIAIAMPATAFILFVLSPLLAISALLQINLKDLPGRGRAKTVLISTSILLVLTSIGERRISDEAYRMVCNSNLRGLGKALVVYNESYHDLPSNWCDCLIKYADVSAKQFLCKASDANVGESSYALNSAVVGKSLDELPPDLVLLFETDYGRTSDGRAVMANSRGVFSEPYYNLYPDTKVYKNRWNQVGGPEILSIKAHGDGCNVLYVNGKVQYETVKTLPNLRWLVNTTNFQFPVHVLSAKIESDKYMRKVLILISVVVVLATVLFSSWFRIWENPLLSLIIGICSGGFGALFGTVAGHIYKQSEFQSLGEYGGFVLGLLFGICFVPFLAQTSRNLKNRRLAGYAASIGMVTGVLCSTSLHVLLMIMHKQMIPDGLTLGLPFGIGSGAILGYVAGKYLNYKRESDSADVQN